MESLPADLVRRWLLQRYLGRRDLASYRAVCRQWRDAVDALGDAVWVRGLDPVFCSPEQRESIATEIDQAGQLVSMRWKSAGEDGEDDGKAEDTRDTSAEILAEMAEADHDLLYRDCNTAPSECRAAQTRAEMHRHDSLEFCQLPDWLSAGADAWLDRDDPWLRWPASPSDSAPSADQEDPFFSETPVDVLFCARDDENFLKGVKFLDPWALLSVAWREHTAENPEGAECREALYDGINLTIGWPAAVLGLRTFVSALLQRASAPKAQAAISALGRFLSDWVRPSMCPLIPGTSSWWGFVGHVARLVSMVASVEGASELEAQFLQAVKESNEVGRGYFHSDVFAAMLQDAAESDDNGTAASAASGAAETPSGSLLAKARSLFGKDKPAAAPIPLPAPAVSEGDEFSTTFKIHELAEAWSLFGNTSAQTIAEQLLLQDIAIWTELDFREASRGGFRESAGKGSLQRAIRRFNALSLAAPGLVLQYSGAKDIERALCHLVSVAAQCKRLGNAHAAMALLTGLQHSAISRLSAPLPKKFEAIREELSDLFSYQAGYRALRQFHGSSACTVPYLGMQLTDVTFILDGNPDFVDAGLNWRKCRYFSEVLHSFRGRRGLRPEYVETHEPIVPLPRLQRALAALEAALDDPDGGCSGSWEEVAFKRSVEVRPRKS
jgi:RasGEF domain